MNVTILVMSSTLASGGEVIPAGWGERAPAVVQTAGGCCTPGATVPAPTGCCDSGRPRLLDRLKSRFAGKKGSDCCDPCAPKYYEPNLLDKLRDRWGAKKGCGCAAPCPAPSCAPPCGPACGPAAVAVPHHPPKDIPKDMTDVKPKPEPEPVKKGGNSGAVVAPNPVPLPPLPSAPVSGPKLYRATSPY